MTSTLKFHLQVFADDELCGTINYVEGQRVYKTSCRSDTMEYRMATNIRIKLKPTERNFLTLCEVQVGQRLLESVNSTSSFLIAQMANNLKWYQAITNDKSLQYLADFSFFLGFSKKVND